MKRQLFFAIILPAVSIILMSWGYTGHEKIGQEAQLSYPPEMVQFNAWTEFLSSHSSDADERKQWDPDEAPKHYIDIDNYDQFILSGTIPQLWDSVIAIYGDYFVYDQGILPWATLTTFDSLKACFERSDWEQAVIFAADLSHYVGDGHMPLHITRNYNGQYSGNEGIHSRYESTMVNNNIYSIIYDGYSVEVVSDINQYVFDYLYTNYTWVDSVLAADDYAKTVSSNTNSSAYKQALWEKSHLFTIGLFRKASHTLAEMIYNAWLQAGSPPMTASVDYYSANVSGISLEKIIPNPFKDTAAIRYKLTENRDVLMIIRDSEGRVVDTLIDGTIARGEHEYIWKSNGLPGGLYFLVMHAGQAVEVRKIILLE